MRYVDVPRMFEDAKRSFGNGGGRVGGGLTNYPIVMLDALADLKPSEWVIEQLYLMVDALWKEKVLVVMTGNVDYEEMLARFGDRTFSRMVGMMDVVEITGPDYRAWEKKNGGAG